VEIGAHAIAAVVPLWAINGWPLRSGFVERLPGCGRRVFARERYVLDGAVPDGDLEVQLLVHLFDPTCSNRPLLFAATPLRTNAAGNGAAELAVRLEDVPPAVRGASHGVRWEIRRGSVALYRTDCTPLEIN
jgi:hypothetical protein